MNKLSAVVLLTVLALAACLGWSIYSQDRLEAHCDDLAASFGAHLSNGRRSESSKYLIWCGSRGPSDENATEIRDATMEIINAGLGQTEISLDLSRTQLTDSAVEALSAIRGLDYIDVSETAISEQRPNASFANAWYNCSLVQTDDRWRVTT